MIHVPSNYDGSLIYTPPPPSIRFPFEREFDDYLDDLGYELISEVAEVSASKTTNSTTLDITNVTVNAGEYLLVRIGYVNVSSRTVSGVMWDQGGTNEALTEIGQIQNSSGGNCGAAMFRIKTPTAGTNKTIRITWTGTVDVAIAVATTYSGVDTGGTSEGTAATAEHGTTATNISCSPASAVGEYTVSVVSKRSDGEPISTDQIEDFNLGTANTGVADRLVGGDHAAGASPSVTHTWSWASTQRHAAMVAVSLKPAAAAGGGLLRRIQQEGLFAGRSA